MEFKGIKKVPEILYAKQYYELDKARRAVSGLYRHTFTPVNAKQECGLAKKDLELAQKKCENEICERIIKPKLKNKTKRNIDATFHDWTLMCEVFFERMNESHNLQPNAHVEDMQEAIKMRAAERTIDDMFYCWAEFGETKGNEFEMPKRYTDNLTITDRTDAEWAQHDKEMEDFRKNYNFRERQAHGEGLLSDADIDALTKNLLQK